MVEINKYNSGKIYKITDNSYTKCYYGSTTNLLCKRFGQHRAGYKSYKLGKQSKNTVYDLFEEFGIENCKIELVELFLCNSKIELEKKEGQYIKENDCVNKICVSRTIKEWRIDNEEKIKQYAKEWRIDNEEKIKQCAKEYSEKNKEILKKKRKDKNDLIQKIKKEQNDLYKMTEEYKETIKQRKAKKYARDREALKQKQLLIHQSK